MKHNVTHDPDAYAEKVRIENPERYEFWYTFSNFSAEELTPAQIGGIRSFLSTTTNEPACALGLKLIRHIRFLEEKLKDE